MVDNSFCFDTLSFNSFHLFVQRFPVVFSRVSNFLLTNFYSFNSLNVNVELCVMPFSADHVISIGFESEWCGGRWKRLEAMTLKNLVKHITFMSWLMNFEQSLSPGIQLRVVC
jgi:hypothetical protein